MSLIDWKLERTHEGVAGIITDSNTLSYDPFTYSSDPNKNSLLFSIGLVKYWTKNYALNRDLIKVSASKVEQSDIVYLVACGKSMEENAKLMKHVKRGRIVAVNGAGAYDMDTHYHFVHDSQGALESDITHDIPYGVYNIYADTIPTHSKFIKDRLWYIPNLHGLLEDEFKGFPSIPVPVNVTYSALWWIALHLKPKVVVLCGLDFGGRVDDGLWHSHAFVEPTPYTNQNLGMVLFMSYHIPLLYFMRMNGIKTIITPKSLLNEEAYVIPLAETIEHINCGLEEKLFSEYKVISKYENSDYNKLR